MYSIIGKFESAREGSMYVDIVFILWYTKTSNPV